MVSIEKEETVGGEELDGYPERIQWDSAGWAMGAWVISAGASPGGQSDPLPPLIGSGKALVDAVGRRMPQC